ncbi:MAG: radical SAM protein, partial [Methanomassiliicoccaceae archaeon]|nr:radical SAM protein [Methanomassiliicoccaceae archaeon]
MTAKDYGVPKGLPKQTTSICPECKKLISATLSEKDGKVCIDKVCPEHGSFSDIYWSDAEIFLRAENFAYDGVGLRNPMDKTSEGKNVCVNIGGKDFEMLTCTALANIDLTNRCNMRCPICFANANQAGYVYEPDYETIVKMLEMLRSEEPIKCTALQFSGGEPTIYPRFVDLIRKAKELGFAQVQAATNGIEFAKNFDLVKASQEAGLNTIYLSFDGVSDDIYLQARDRKMFDIKLKVLENLRKLEKPPSVVLVPTIVRGVNDHQIGDIINFALENSDLIRAVNFQPVAFTGRITKEDLTRGRFTLTDLIKAEGEQTGYTSRDDWFPVPVVAPISKLASLLLGENKVTFTTHPHCGIATYL